MARAAGGGAALKVWKVLGVAGLAGVAAGGAAVARAERRRRSFSPDDVRARLHQRYQEVAEAELPAEPQAEPARPSAGCLAGPSARVRRRAQAARARRRC